MHHARDRGIEWDIKFEDWVAWWETNLGPDWINKRGRGKGKYCMARRNDVGSYTLHNVQCVLFEENLRESAKRKIGPRNPFWGKKHSEKTKVKIRVAKLMREAKA